MNKTNRVIIFLVVVVCLVMAFLFRNKNSSGDGSLNSQKPKNNETTQAETGTFTDERDGKTYKWVKIGNQTWMGENLAYKPESGFWSYEDETSNVETYGYLYDWQTAQSIAPAGWHLPSKSEWETLDDYLGEHSAGQLKESGTDHWQSPNTGATNSSHFTGLPSGGNFDGEYLMIGRKGYFWSSTEIDDANAYALTLESDSASISWYSGTKVRGLSIRCVKD